MRERAKRAEENGEGKGSFGCQFGRIHKRSGEDEAVGEKAGRRGKQVKKDSVKVMQLAQRIMRNSPPKIQGCLRTRENRTLANHGGKISLQAENRIDWSPTLGRKIVVSRSTGVIVDSSGAASRGKVPALRNEQNLWIKDSLAWRRDRALTRITANKNSSGNSNRITAVYE